MLMVLVVWLVLGRLAFAVVCSQISALSSDVIHSLCGAFITDFCHSAWIPWEAAWAVGLLLLFGVGHSVTCRSAVLYVGVQGAEYDDLGGRYRVESCKVGVAEGQWALSQNARSERVLMLSSRCRGNSFTAWESDLIHAFETTTSTDHISRSGKRHNFDFITSRKKSYS
jgi:hypothetical protein